MDHLEAGASVKNRGVHVRAVRRLVAMDGEDILARFVVFILCIPFIL
ncbi:MAG: hypothetical protein WCP35_13125 [Verrucomicrobiota bacterium]